VPAHPIATEKKKPAQSLHESIRAGFLLQFLQFEAVINHAYPA
jgi:hypothetical protein